MASIRKQTWTKPIPPGAEIVLLDDDGKPDPNGKPHARFRNRRKKLVTAPLTADGQRILLESKSYYVEIDGKMRKSYSDKRLATVQATDLERKLARRELGLTDPYEEHNERPLLEHLADFQAELESRPKISSSRYANQVVSHVKAMLDGCGFKVIPDIDAQKVAAWLKSLRKQKAAVELTQDEYRPAEAAVVLGLKPASVSTAVLRHRLPATGQGKARRYPKATVQALLELSTRGASVRTVNAYTTSIKAFGAWLADDDRMPNNPFARLELGNVEVDKRHARRDLTGEELGLLFATTQASETVFRGFNGIDRYMLYLLAHV